jgi:hypothetical protein
MLQSGRKRRHRRSFKAALSVERSRVTCPDIELASPAIKAQRINMSNGLQEAAMDSSVSRENIKRYRKLASESTDAAQRSRILSLLAEEEDKLKLELSGRRDARLASLNVRRLNYVERYAAGTTCQSQ